MKIKNKLALPMLFALSMLSSPSIYAITYADCVSDPSNEIDCAHKTTAMISGFDQNGATVVGTRCSATLIYKDSIKYVFLTAGHCGFSWVTGIEPGGVNKPPADVASLGVTMDPVVIHPDPLRPAYFNNSQFVLGGIPVYYKLYGGGTVGGTVNAFNPSNDWGFMIFPANAVNPLTNKTIDQTWNPPIQTLAQDVGLSLDALVGSVNSPNKDLIFSASGYGIIEAVNFPGNNAGGAGSSSSSLGTLRVANDLAFRNMNGDLITYSTNPAKGNNGVCGGDSGGPQFYNLNGEDIQIGVASSGDGSCRSWGSSGRIDITPAIDFINCARAPGASIAALKQCGISKD
jgi:hypothetical protein